jgi:hypothetical protein
MAIIHTGPMAIYGDGYGIQIQKDVLRDWPAWLD